MVSRCLSQRPELLRAAERASAAGKIFRDAWSAWTDVTTSSDQMWCDQASLAEADLGRLEAALDKIDRRFADLDDWVAFNAVWKEVTAGMLGAAATWAVSPAARDARSKLAEVFERRIYELWIESVIDEAAVLADFHGEDHAVILERFRELDRLWIEATRSRVARALRERQPELSGTSRRGSKLAVLEAEFRKKRRHLPIRRVLREAGDVIQAIKPCFMMSPISVAQYLAPGDVDFDVVIFDEASQVEPADAFGAIARARQVLLVGDEKQLPPTRFFTKVETDAPATDDDDETEGDDVGKDMESILGLGMVRMPHRFSLRWHYRSAHESLISFSNEKFYDGLLRVFPSAADRIDSTSACSGATWAAGISAAPARPIPKRFVPSSTRWSRTRVRIPRRPWVWGRSTCPSRSRSRTSSSGGGARAKTTRSTPSCPRTAWNHSSIKNLETIQGDERDVILLQRHLWPRREWPGLSKLRAPQPRGRLEAHERAGDPRPRTLCRLQLPARRRDSPAGHPFPRRRRVQGLPALRRARHHARLGGRARPGRSPLEEEIAKRCAERDGRFARGSECRASPSISRSSIRNAAADTWSASNAMARPIALRRPRAIGIGCDRACSRSSGGD